MIHDWIERGDISIHALRGEGDARISGAARGYHHISIHALRGEGDLSTYSMKSTLRRFQSTPSVGRATVRA